MATYTDPIKAYPTTLKMLLNEWTELHDVVQAVTTPLQMAYQNSQKNDPSQSALLTDRQVHDLFHGPFHHFFTEKCKAYAALLAQKVTQLAQDEGWEKPAFPNTLTHTSSTAPLSKQEQMLHTLTQQHAEAWLLTLQKWQQELQGLFKQAGLGLADNEAQSLLDREPFFELIDRYTELKLTPPTTNTPISFSDYLTWKAKLVLHSLFSRQHQPHAENDLQTGLKPFKPFFERVKREERSLSTTQTAAMTPPPT